MNISAFLRRHGIWIQIIVEFFFHFAFPFAYRGLLNKGPGMRCGWRRLIYGHRSLVVLVLMGRIGGANKKTYKSIGYRTSLQDQIQSRMSTQGYKGEKHQRQARDSCKAAGGDWMYMTETVVRATSHKS